MGLVSRRFEGWDCMGGHTFSLGMAAFGRTKAPTATGPEVVPSSANITL